jgi:hypothetical protein
MFFPGSNITCFTFYIYFDLFTDSASIFTILKGLRQVLRDPSLERRSLGLKERGTEEPACG